MPRGPQTLPGPVIVFPGSHPSQTALKYAAESRSVETRKYIEYSAPIRMLITREVGSVVTTAEIYYIGRRGH